MKKAAAAFCGMLWCVMLFCVPASAAIPWTPTDRFFVNDFADVISAEDEERIYQAGVQLFEKTKAQVVAVDDALLYHEFWRLRGVKMFEEAPPLLGGHDFSLREPAAVEAQLIERYRALKKEMEEGGGGDGSGQNKRHAPARAAEN